MWSWLRRTFVTGFFVTVPLAVSVIAIVWVVRLADSLTAGLGERLVGRTIPGLGLLVTAVIVLTIGVIATNMIGRRIVQKGESILLHVPLFRTIYAPVKQLVSAFSPDNEFGFKRMVMVDDRTRGFVLGFLTKEFAVDRGHGPETLLAVYVPTNHLYLGDIIVVHPEQASFPEMTVEEGIRVFLTGGMGIPEEMRLEGAGGRASSDR
jgi:uncharacterized membrane protein